ncbi:hypothetical protein D3C87_1101390 [compost metagenome]
MTVQRDTLLCSYHYEPLDRIASCVPLNQQSIQRFYRKDRLTTETQGPVQHSVFEHDAQLLAQQQRQLGKVDPALLATDLQRSVLHLVSVDHHQQPVYTPYGHRFPEGGLISLLGFNGERRDLVTGHYLLGNGYRAFNPVLMRFNSPDNLSPFGKGGVNAYAYGVGDPVNRVDPSGEFALFAPLVDGVSSLAASALQQALKRLNMLKASVINRSTKMPARPGHGTLSNAESGRDRLSISKAAPREKSSMVVEANARADEQNVYSVGAKYRKAESKVSPDELRRSKLQSFANGEALPQEMQYKFPPGYGESRYEFRQANRDLALVVFNRNREFPGEATNTVTLVQLIRNGEQTPY